MAIADDWTINYGAKTVTHSSGTTVYTMLAFFQYLATEAAKSAQMDDPYPIQSDTPTVYKWLNGWYFGVEATDTQFLSGGSIVDDDESEAYANLYSIGAQEAGTQIYVVQNSAELTPWWGTGNIDILIKVKAANTWIQSDDTAGTPTNGGVWAYARESDYEYDHNFVDLSGLGANPVGINNGNDLAFDGAYGEKYLAVPDVTGFDVGNYVEDTTAGGTARINFVDATNDFLYLVMVEGTFTATNTIQESLTRGGTSTGTTTTITSVNDDIDQHTDIIPVFVTREFSGGTTSGGPFTVGETVTQTGTGATFLFANEETGNVLHMEDVAGSPNATGLLTGGTSGATYTPTTTVAATSSDIDLNNGAGAQPYNVFVQCATNTVLTVYQYLKVIARHNSAETINGDTGEEYRSANEGTYTDIKKAPFGTFAGGTFFGARGVWLDNYAVASFSLTDANNTLQNPPDYQKAVVSNASLSGCQVFVAEITGDGGTYTAPYTVASTTTNSITIQEASINANKTPQSGVIRIITPAGDDDTEFSYTSFSGQVFSGVSPDPSAAGIGNGDTLNTPLISLLADAVSEQSDNVIYTAPFWCRAVVRKYGFKPFSVDQQFGANGLNISAILADDPQAS